MVLISLDILLRHVPNSKCASVMGQYKCNSSSLLNHRLIHVTFFTGQTYIQSDFTMVRPGPIVKKNSVRGLNPQSLSQAVCLPFCATTTGKIYPFAPLNYVSKKRISIEKVRKIY